MCGRRVFPWSPRSVTTQPDGDQALLLANQIGMISYTDPQTDTYHIVDTWWTRITREMWATKFRYASFLNVSTDYVALRSLPSGIVFGWGSSSGDVPYAEDDYRVTDDMT